MTVLGVALGGAIGAVFRFVIDRGVQQRQPTILPLGTLVVNVSGAFLLGLVTGLSLYHGLGHMPTATVGVGFLGAYTTMSTLSFESLSLLQDGAILAGLTNMVVSLTAGVAAAAAGFILAGLV